MRRSVIFPLSSRRVHQELTEIVTAAQEDGERLWRVPDNEWWRRQGERLPINQAPCPQHVKGVDQAR